MRWILKGNKVGDGEKFIRNCGFKAGNFRHKKVSGYVTVSYTQLSSPR